MFYPVEALFSTIMASIKAGQPISILVGSPLTAPDISGGLGVPNVGDMISLIEQKSITHDINNDYLNFTSNTEWASKYQKGFDFIKGWLGQDIANEIITEAVHRSIDNDTGEWYFPKAVKNLTDLIELDTIKIDSIFTTNFDTLIEESLNKRNIDYIAYIFDNDGKLENSHVRNENAIKIIHLHGTWNRSDTLHTSDQLTARRDNLKNSIKKIISNNKLLVIGYSGWDDIFIESLKEIIHERTTKFDILWSFYGDNEKKIKSDNKKLLDAATPAIQRGRFRAYKNIDIRNFFEELKTKIDNEFTFKINKTNKNGELEKQNKKNKQTQTQVHLQKFMLEKQPAHDNIRSAEQNYFSKTLKNGHVISIINEWGSGKYGFLSSSLRNNAELEKTSIFRIDLSKISSGSELQTTINQQLGLDLALFISSSQQFDNSILLLDNVPYLNENTIFEEIKNVIDTTVDYTKNIRFILTGDKNLEKLGYPTIILNSLDDADIFQFIKTHQHGKNEYLRRETLNKISSISNGLPVKLDILLSNLRVIDVDEFIEDFDENIFNSDISNDYIPKLILDFINELNNSENEKKIEYFTILKILAVLEHGETYKNIRKYYSDKNIKIASFTHLIDMGLVTSTHSEVIFSSLNENKNIVILSLHPLIGSYVRQKINADELFDLTKTATELLFGPEWLSGKLKLNTSVKEHFIDISSSGLGNAHNLLCSFMRKALERGLVRETKAIYHIALSYLDYLSSHGRFKDIVTTAGELYILVKDSALELPYYKVMYFHGQGLRMLSMRDEAITKLESILSLNETIDNKHLIYIYNELALAYKTEGNNEKSCHYANILKKLVNRHTPQYFNAESILAQEFETDKRIAKLKNLEKRSRRLGHTLSANNIVFSLADEVNTPEEAIKLYEKITTTENDGYTKIRSFLRKINIILNNKPSSDISLQDKIFLYKAYSYLFNQRLDNLLESCHGILWRIFTDQKDYQSLVNLFKYSSLIWRLNSNSDTELSYARQLKATNFDTGNNTEELINYAQARLQLLETREKW
ncbi:SIR2 family protein [Yersinia enterocolitica]